MVWKGIPFVEMHHTLLRQEVYRACLQGTCTHSLDRFKRLYKTEE